MGGRKTTSTTNTENTYDWMKIPSTPELEAFKSFEIQDDPSAPFLFAGQRRDLLNTYQNPYGSYTTPEMREQMTRAGLAEIGQNEAQAFRERNFDKNRMKLGQLQAAMAYSRPELVQTKGTSTTTQKQSGGWLGSLLQGAATVGSAFI
jgi:hypothetical protein